MEIDHILLFISKDGSEVNELDAFGLLPGRKVTHPGQGTSNTCYAFENAYLELVWASNQRELQTPAIRPTGMWRRTLWWENHACPFGLAMRRGPEEKVRLPFPTWDYRPPYLPDSIASIQIGAESENVDKPFVFVLPEVMPEINKGAHKLQTNPYFTTITRVGLILPFDYRESVQISQLVEQGVLDVQRGDNYHMTLEINHHQQGQQHAFAHPHLPLTLFW